MNTPITKKQVADFKNDDKLKFLITGSGKNRRQRRAHFVKHRKKDKMIIFRNPQSKIATVFLERWQSILLKSGVIKKIFHSVEA